MSVIASARPHRLLRDKSSASLSGLVVAIGLLGATGVAAAPAANCYSQAEFAAEQAIRLHSEMMVTALKCHKAYEDRKPFQSYAEFTQRLGKMIAGYEAILIGYQKKVGEANPTRSFDRFRTVIANDYAQRANMEGVESFCPAQLDRMFTLTQMNDKQFRNEAEVVRVSALATRPLCSAGRVIEAAAPARRPAATPTAAAATAVAAVPAPAKPAAAPASAKPATPPAAQVASIPARTAAAPAAGKPAVPAVPVAAAPAKPAPAAARPGAHAAAPAAPVTPAKPASTATAAVPSKPAGAAAAPAKPAAAATPARTPAHAAVTTPAKPAHVAAVPAKPAQVAAVPAKPAQVAAVPAKPAAAPAGAAPRRPGTTHN